MKKLTTIGTLAIAVLFASSASAQDPAAPAATPPPAADMAVPAGGGMPPITGVRAGGIAVWGSLNVNLSKSAVAKPFGIAPDIIYGVSDVLAVALAHSTYALTGFAGGVGDSLCLAGKSDGCLKAYNTLGLLGKYALNSDLAVDGGLVFGSLDPNMTGLKVGVSGRVMGGPVMIMYEPNLIIGLNKRDAGNKGTVNIPVMGMMPFGAIMGGIQTGIRGPMDKFGDNYAIPLSFVAMTHINPTLMAGAAFTLINLAGKDSLYAGKAGADGRALNIFVGWNN